MRNTHGGDTTVFVWGMALLLTFLCLSIQAAETITITGETLVLAGEVPGKLGFDRLMPGSVVVRSAYDPKGGGGGL